MKGLDRFLVGLTTGLFLCTFDVAGQARPESSATTHSARLEAVKSYANNVLDKGRDVYGETPTPLFVDGLDVATMKPIEVHHKGNVFVLSNQASQQHLLRVLVGLSNLTGNNAYRDAAIRAVEYHFKHLIRPCGLLQWGGHRALDLKSGKFVTRDIHELKNHFPFYELMWEVDPKATERYIQAFWNAHILDWSKLDMNRHGSYGKPMGELWESAFVGEKPFFHGHGLTFINTGGDLTYAAGMLFALGGDEAALRWSIRLAEQYVKARHPKTGLGVYQYSQPLRQLEPPTDPSAPNYTYSIYGDRTQRQFGPEFGAIALEGYFLPNERGIYTTNAYMQLKLAEILEENGKDFLQWTHEALRAYAKHAYDSETHTVRPMFADGTDLTNYVIQRYGYHGQEGKVMDAQQASVEMFLSYATGYRLTLDPLLWETTRSLAQGHGLGDIGLPMGRNIDVNRNTDNHSPVALFALLELFRAHPESAYLELAKRIGDNILEKRFRNGFFVSGPHTTRAVFGAIEPLALLTLEALIQGEPEAIPSYTGGREYFFSP